MRIQSQACELREIPLRRDPRGSLCFAEAGRHIPFDIQRAFWISDVAHGANRGDHAHRSLHQFLVAMTGSFRVTAKNAFSETEYRLVAGGAGLYAPPLNWLLLDLFEPGSLCCVFTSDFYDGEDYIHDWKEFEKLVGTNTS